jgi:hypothetical protein
MGNKKLRAKITSGKIDFFNQFWHIPKLIEDLDFYKKQKSIADAAI